ncbi:MAG: hypothetical protein SVP26_07885, partial [Chloroflexota bacterium]|nr:hypothetical protein [Chloroflexota bacterium]
CTGQVVAGHFCSNDFPPRPHFGYLCCLRYSHSLFGTAFIYSGIYNVMRAIYLLYGFIAMTLLLHKLVRTFLQERSIRKWVSGLGGLTRSQVFVGLSLAAVFLLTVLLTERGHGIGGLTERGLTFLVLLSSCLIGSLLVEAFTSRKGKVLSNVLILILVVFLTLSFPAMAYKSEASLSIPVSEEEGVRFLAENVALDEKTLAMAGVGQLAYFPEATYARPNFASIGLPWPEVVADIEADIAVFRRTDYYYAAMARDLSFEDNAVTEYLGILSNSSSHNRVYSNPAFDVFLKR